MAKILLSSYEVEGGRGCNGGTGFEYIRYEHFYDPGTELASTTEVHKCYQTEQEINTWYYQRANPFHGYCLLDTGTYREFTHNGAGEVSYVDLANDSRCRPPMVISHTAFNSCFSGTTGSINLEVTGGLAPYTYLWNDGVTTPNRSFLPTGNYSVTVTDAAAITAVKEIMVGQYSQIEVIGTIGNEAISLNVTGGTAPYTFLWNDGATTKDRAGIVPGAYSCTITDSAGCTKTVQFDFDGERFHYSRNPVLLNLQTNDPETKPNLTFLCEVWIEPDYLSDAFVKVTEEPLEHPADSAGEAVFNVRKFLHAYMTPHFPAFGQTTISRAESAFKRFYLKHTEKFGNPPVPGFYTQIEKRYALLGGLSQEEHFAQTFFNSYLDKRKPFFTWDHPIKEVFTDQPEFLFFMPQSLELEAFQVMAKVSFADGSVMTYQVHEQAGLHRFELYCIPVGHDQLALAAKKPATKVLSWDIYVRDPEGIIISETRRFIVNATYYRHKRYLLYDNSLGGINTLVALGPAKEKLDPEVQQLERLQTPDYNPELGEVNTIDKYYRPSIELSTGHRPRLQVRAMKDFILSKHIRLITADRYITPTLIVKNVVSDDENENFLFIDFELQLPREYNFTPVLRASGYGDEGNVTNQLKPIAP